MPKPKAYKLKTRQTRESRDQAQDAEAPAFPPAARGSRSYAEMLLEAPDNSLVEFRVMGYILGLHWGYRVCIGVILG